MLIRLLTLGVVFFLVARLFQRWRRGRMSLRKAALWVGLWLTVAVTVTFPEATVDRVAAWFGVETATGIDFLVYLAVGLAYYLLYRVSVRLDRLQQETTRLVRHLALREAAEEERDRADLRG